MPRTKPAYPAEFKAEANSAWGDVYNVGRHAEIDDGVRDALPPSEREELRQLRREVRTLRHEREILKKAAAFFAKESDMIR